MKLKLIVFAGVVLGIFAVLIAQGSGTGAIFGYVHNTSGELVGGVTVEVVTDAGTRSSTSRGRESVCYDGGYFLDKLPPGRHKLCISSETHQSAEIEVELGAGERKRYDIEVIPLSAVCGSIEGTLHIIGEGQKLPLLEVRCTDAQTKELLSTVKTKEDGKFRFDMLPEGSYNITVYYRRDLIESVKKVSVKKQKTTEKKIGLKAAIFEPEPGWLYGKVTAEGKPTKGCTVRIIDGQKKGSARTDSKGNYKIDKLPPGKYTVSAGKGRLVSKPNVQNMFC